MFNRRKFLKTSVASLAVGIPGAGVYGARSANHRPAVRGLYFFEASPNFQTARVTAAAFHSDHWGLGRATSGYDALVLPSLRKEKFTYSQVKEIDGQSELIAHVTRCDVFVALANPDDQMSMNMALEHCDIAKRAGAFTVLLAAEAFPDPEHDQTTQLRFLDRNSLPNGYVQPDAIFRFETIEPYMEMANVASLFGLHYEVCHNLDLSDIKTVLNGKSDVVKLESGAFGPGRGHRAATEALRFVQDGKIDDKVIKGAVIFFLCGRNYPCFDESYAAVDVFNASVGQRDGAFVVGYVPARGSDADFLGITALITV